MKSNLRLDVWRVDLKVLGLLLAALVLCGNQVAVTAEPSELPGLPATITVSTDKECYRVGENIYITVINNSDTPVVHHHDEPFIEKFSENNNWITLRPFTQPVNIDPMPISGLYSRIDAHASCRKNWSAGPGVYRVQLRHGPDWNQCNVVAYSNEFRIVPAETSPLSLIITINQRVISDTQPIQIAVSLINNLDTPTLVDYLPFNWQVYHVTTPAGDTFYLAPPMIATPPSPTWYHWSLIQPHQSYTTGHDLRTLNGYNSTVFKQPGIYKIHTTFSQSARDSYLVVRPSHEHEVIPVEMIPVKLVSNTIELEKK